MSAAMSVEGRLSDHPFVDALAILANSKESGRLQIDFKCGQGLFYFDKGELAAAQVGPLMGFSAVSVALSMEGTCFRFDPHAQLVATQFSETNERLLLNRLLGMQTAVSCVEHDLTDSIECTGLTQTPASPATSWPTPPPPTVVSPAKPEPPRHNVDLLWQFLANSLTQSATYSERRKLTFGAASILLFGILVAAGITVFRSKASAPVSRPMPSQTPAKATPEATRASFSSRIEGKSGPVSASTNTSRQSLSESAPRDTKLSSKSKNSRSSQANATFPEKTKAIPGEPAKDEPLEERAKTVKPVFREISVVLKIENGQVAEAYVENRQPGSEAYESTALRLARQRRYPKDASGTKTIVFSVASEQPGVPSGAAPLGWRQGGVQR